MIAKFDKYKRIIILVVLVLMCANTIITPLASNALNYSGDIGTNAALGSPLLNENNWDNEDWNQWEMVCFGVFLSNFCEPFVDSYMTAFQSGKGGTDGRGLTALQFGSGSDFNGDGILQSLLTYAIKFQTQSLKEIKVDYVKVTDGVKADTRTTKRAATMEDLFIYVFDSNLDKLFDWGGDHREEDSPYIDGIETKEIDNFKFDITWNPFGNKVAMNFKYAKDMNLPTFYVSTTSSDEDQVILDYTDGYDIQMSALAINKALYGQFSGQATKNFESMVNSKQKLYMDIFGNIVAQNDSGQYVIVMPASTNQHLTNDKKYNLLNSFVMMDNYVSATGNSLVGGVSNALDMTFKPSTPLTVWYNSRTMGTTAIAYTKGDQLDGSTMMYFDSDYALYKRIRDKVKGGKTLDDAVDEVISDGFVDIQWGSVLTTLIDAKMTEDHSDYPFEIEVMGVSADREPGSFAQFFKAGSFGRRCVDAMNATAYISNWFPTDTNAELLNYMYTIDGKRLQLFKNKTYIAPLSGSYTQRQYINYAMSYADQSKKLDLSGVSSGSVLSQSDFYSKLKSKKRVTNVGNFLFNKDEAETVVGDKEANGLYSYFMQSESGLKLNKASTKTGATVNDVHKTIQDKTSILKIWTVEPETLAGDANVSTCRMISMFQHHSGLKTAANIFGVADGMEFAAYTPWIYLTYLDFYGLVDKAGESDFNKKIFENSDILKTKAEDLFEGVTLSEEEKKAQITDYTWKLLSPKQGRSYRNELIEGIMNEFLYNQYKKAVYGSSGVSTINSSISSSVSDGFLRLSSLSENKFTSFFIETYASNAMILMLVVLLISIVGGLMQGRGVSYFFASFMLTISVLLLSPNIGDIAPYLCNKLVQNMFNENMRYWAISESIENSQIEREYGSSSDEEEAAVPMLVRMLNVNYLDRTIMIKGDISKKIVESQAIDFNELQKLKTARWLIPSLMRQFSQEEGKADYVYTPLGDLYRNMSISYWYYTENPKVSLDKSNNPTYSANNYKEPVVTYTSGSEKSEFSLYDSDKKKEIYSGYTNTKNTSGSPDYHALSRLKSDEENSHTQFYMLNFGSKLKVMSPLEYTDLDLSNGLTTSVWDGYAQKIADGSASTVTDSLRSVADIYMWNILNNYNSYQNGMPGFFNYLWMTENPAMYFYHNVKDTFEPTYGVAAISMELQGFYDKIDLDGDGNPDTEEMRHSFMHDATNGEVRDFLDLEELFTNVIPYLYNVQIIAGGNNGINGAFGAEKLGESYAVYSENLKSWMFRSNWVTKIEESRIYNSKDTIGYIDDSGNRQTVEIIGGLHPSNYSKYRPMVFSKAQMRSLGLTSADLSLVENKILKVNDAVMLDWTLLTNYANTGGMTSEVLYRQMAIDALLQFNKEFSPDNGINAAMSLHPTTLDLRSISFDSVMKLLMVSSTTNAQYIYADTMQSVISDSSTFSAIVLLLDAEICNALIPNIRDLAMAFVFYLMLWNLAMCIIKQDRSKAKIIVGTLLINLRYALYTIAYYAVFYLLISMSTPDQILSVSKLSITSSVPTFKFVAILIASGTYTYFLIKKIIIFTWQNRNDMGFDTQMTMLSNLADRVGSGFRRVTGAVNTNSSSVSSTIMESNKKLQTEVKNSKREPVKTEIVDGQVDIKNGSRDTGEGYKVKDSGYFHGSDTKEDVLDSDAINNQINKGRDIAKDDKK